MTPACGEWHWFEDTADNRRQQPTAATVGETLGAREAWHTFAVHNNAQEHRTLLPLVSIRGLGGCQSLPQDIGGFVRHGGLRSGTSNTALRFAALLVLRDKPTSRKSRDQALSLLLVDRNL